ncbi:MAG: hypothetical protein O3A00_05735 [Planctomycetota bacterium]|nr:hypothetical protein [Planctomycetota bacterium]
MNSKHLCVRCKFCVRCLCIVGFVAGLLAIGVPSTTAAEPKPEADRRYPDTINVNVPHVSTDKSIQFDYDIVYVRTPRKGDEARSLWTEIAHPGLMDAGGDLMLLHPDGREEVLVPGGENGSVTDPMVSLDGEWVFYSHIRGLKGTSQHGQPPFGGADIHKIHVKTRKIVRLTHGKLTPNTGAADWADDPHKSTNDKTWHNYGVLNMGPCPLPGGRLVFTSSRNGFIPPKHPSPCQQLFVMDDDGRNVEMIGHLNIGMALHPVVLKDGRIIFSSLESQGLRSSILWGLWTINPDGTGWGPVLSALMRGGAPDAFHFQSQLSDGHIVAEKYYNQNNSGFGGFYKLPAKPPSGYSAFGPGWDGDPRNPPLRSGRHYNSKPKLTRLPFSPAGIESLTRFTEFGEGPADNSVVGQKDSPRVGKFTHPSGAPDNHLLACYSPGPVNHQYKFLPMPDGGLYLIKDGQPIDEPAEMRLIKNDPNYNEQWPRALVPYKRIFGIDEPARLEPLANNGKLSPELPEGSPFGLVGTSSFYKRESYPSGIVPADGVTARATDRLNTPGSFLGLDPFNTSQNGASLNWSNQGSDAGRYSNDEIHAVRIVAMEPTTHRHRGPKSGRRFLSHATERLRILGEIPLRKFSADKEPVDPDGNPDTSFLAKIPADTAYTFQTLDRDGMVLNIAQTWHQLRPGEIRNDCGGCHAHSQKPTLFEHTSAARKDYEVFDLTRQTPLLTDKQRDESKRKWDRDDSTGVRFAEGGIKNVEYHRDIKPILLRSCAACHSHKSNEPAGQLVLDSEQPVRVTHGPEVPETYYRLALDREAKYGFKPVIHNGSWRQTNASRYIRKFQSRRSLLVWKIHGRRSDGWTNDDFPTAEVPGDASTLKLRGEAIENTQRNRDLADLDYNGRQMPPPDAVAGKYVGPNGEKIKVEPLTDEDRRTLVRWIDLGCPIDLDYDAMRPEDRGYGWMVDDNRPVLTLTHPRRGTSGSLTRIVIGMYDYYTGLDEDSLTVTADFAVDGIAAGENLAKRFKSTSPGVWELTLTKPLERLGNGTLTVSVQDREGNLTRIERTISVSAK